MHALAHLLTYLLTELVRVYKTGNIIETVEDIAKATTLCSEKNTHSRFLLYLRGKCLDL